jgi:hypothetical protein
MSNRFVTLLSKIGSYFKEGLAFVEKYMVPASALVTLLFPSAAPEAAGVLTSIQLIQTAVTEIEQKYAASGAAGGTGTQKLADVLTIVTPVVTTLLTQEGVKNVNQAYITSIVNAVVAILNAQPAPAS